MATKALFHAQQVAEPSLQVKKGLRLWFRLQGFRVEGRGDSSVKLRLSWDLAFEVGDYKDCGVGVVFAA